MSRGKKVKPWPETLKGFLDHKYWNNEFDKEAFDKVSCEIAKSIENIRSAMYHIGVGVKHKDVTLARDWDSLSAAVDRLYDILDIANLRADNKRRNELVRQRVKDGEAK